MISNLAADVRAFTSNAFLVSGERPVLVDTGANFDVVARVAEHVDNLDAVILTHTHTDHVGNLDAVVDAFDVPVYGFDADRDGVERAIADEERVQLGDDSYVALQTPGHKADHLCFYARDAGILFTGDLVFANGNVGRTDLAEGDRDALIESVDRLLATVDDSLAELHAGHGPSVADDPYEHLETAASFARRA